MADDATTTDDTTTEPPEGAEEDASSNGENTGDDQRGGQPSWDEFLDGLSEEDAGRIRAHLKGSREKLDSDLRRVRTENRELRRRAQDAEAKAARVDEVQNGKQAAEAKVDELTTAARQENEALRKRLVEQEIKVQAAAMSFADPEDPAAALAEQVADLMDTDLEPDREAISDALKDLLERKPHWVKQQEVKPRPPAAPKAQGSSGSSTSSPGSKGLAEAMRRYGQKAS